MHWTLAYTVCRAYRCKTGLVCSYLHKSRECGVAETTSSNYYSNCDYDYDYDYDKAYDKAYEKAYD